MCGSPCSSSQSNSSSWMNGQATTTTTLQFYVVGSSGRQALTSVRELSSGSSGNRVNVQVGLWLLGAAVLPRTQFC